MCSRHGSEAVIQSRYQPLAAHTATSVGAKPWAAARSWCNSGCSRAKARDSHRLASSGSTRKLLVVGSSAPSAPSTSVWMGALPLLSN